MKLDRFLLLESCPHCGISTPSLALQNTIKTRDYKLGIPKVWCVYVCATCGALVTAWALEEDGEVIEVHPKPRVVNEHVPERAKTYLSQALASRHAPSGAVMLAASAVDSMLKIKGYTEGSLYARIDKAATDHVITSEIASWAHEVRLDANAQRHADDHSSLPSQKEADESIDFALAIAEYLFVLPARVALGRARR